MISKQFAKRRKDSAVSPVIATILMVAITVVLAAVLYVMVGGFTHNPGTAQSAGMNEGTGTAAGSYVVTISSVSASNIQVSGLKIVVSGATYNACNGAFANTSAATPGAWSTASTTAPGVQFSILSGNSPSYLAAGDTITLTLPTVAAASNGFSGATVTLYSGNSQLGTVTL